MKANECYMPMDENGTYWPKWADKWKTVVVSELNHHAPTWRKQGITVAKVEIVPARRKSPQQPRRKET